MKKFIALVLTLALAVSLCACSSKASSHHKASQNTGWVMADKSLETTNTVHALYEYKSR